MVEYGDITSSVKTVEVPFAQRKKLMQLIIEALSRMQRAGIGDVPKHHAAVHMTFRFRWQQKTRFVSAGNVSVQVASLATDMTGVPFEIIRQK